MNPEGKMKIMAVAVIAIAGILIIMFIGTPKWEAFDRNKQYKVFLTPRLQKWNYRNHLVRQR